jgi:acyl carrier protein
MNKIETVIYNQIKKKTKNVKLNQNLISNNIIDSFDMMELIIFCEKKFKMRFKEKDLMDKNFESIAKIALIISNYKKTK